MCKVIQQPKRKRFIKQLLLSLVVILSISSAKGEIANGGKFPQWSPIGDKIAFLSSTPHQPKSLWMIDSTGKNCRKLTLHEVAEYQWSMDGKSIRYSTYQDGNQVWMEYFVRDTENIVKISTLPENSENPMWSPNEDWIAYLQVDSTEKNLWIVKTDGTQRFQISSTYWVQNPHWIDNNSILYQVGQPIPNILMKIDINTMKTKILNHSFSGEVSLSNDKKQIALPVSIGGGKHKLTLLDIQGKMTKEFPIPDYAGGEVKWSPNNKKMTYNGKIMHDYSVWVINVDGTQSMQLTTKDIQGSSPSWSIDGKLMVYAGISPKSTATDLFIIQSNGKGIRRLTQSVYSQWAPQISPNGSKIAFFSTESKKTKIQICTPEGKNIVQIPNIQIDYNSRLIWAPDGKRIMLTANNRIEVFELSTTGNRRFLQFPNGIFWTDFNYRNGKLVLSSLKYGKPHILVAKIDEVGSLDLTDIRIKNSKSDKFSPIELQPSWSPKGDHIAFISNNDLWIMNADGNNGKLIYKAITAQEDKENQRAISTPRWSPMGNQLLFNIARQENKITIKEIWIINTDGTNPRVLRREPIHSEFSLFDNDYTYPPSFTPDGKYIYFTSDRDGIPQIYRIPVNGGKEEKISLNGGIFPDFMPEEDILIYTSLNGNKERLVIKDLTGQENHETLLLK